MSRCALCLLLLGGLLPTLALGQVDPEDYPEMLERSSETRTLSPEPEMFSESYRARGRGISFGVGFRRLDFTLNDGQTRTFGDSTANGIGFHISYVEPERALEYERQISPVAISKEIQYQGKNYNSLEVIQNNVWYWWATPLSSRWWSHYGSGFQFAQIRPIAEDQTKTYVDESSLVFGGGLGWFAVPSLLLSYRFTLSFHLSTMGISEHDPILPRSQVHTIYFDYFYAL